MRVHGHSMNPVLSPGDLLLVRELSAGQAMPARGKLVVARPAELEVQYFVKRVIGCPGETVRSSDKAWKLGEEECFLLGDNAELSIDSRIFGPISRKELLGLVVMRLWPLKAISKEWVPDSSFVDVSSPEAELPAEALLAEAAV